MAMTKVNKDKEMAADLRKRGIWHGKRQTSSNVPGWPAMTDVGSAAYRRLRRIK